METSDNQRYCQGGRRGIHRLCYPGALNRMDGISEENHSRILQVCERLSYAQQPGRSLVKPGTQTIGIIMPDIMSPFIPEAHGEGLRMLPTKRVSGIIMQQLPGLKARGSYLKLLAGTRWRESHYFPFSPRGARRHGWFIHNVPMVALSGLTGQCGIPMSAPREGAGGQNRRRSISYQRCRNLLFVGFKPERLIHR